MKSFSSVFQIGLLVLSFSNSALALEPDSSFLKNLEPLQNAVYVSTPEQTHQPLYDAFANAKTSIKVGIFSISSKEITQKLCEAQKRGISVTVIEDASFQRSPGKQELVNQLKSAGINFMMASPGFSISHWKFFVIDDRLAYISTMNWVTRTDQMRDMGVFVTNPSIIAELLSVYNQDIINSKNSTAITPTLTQPNLVWSPINSEAKIVALINSAQTSIDIWIENMGETNVHDALKNAVNRKVKVRLLTSQCGLGMPASASFPILKTLSEAGIDVRGEPFPANEEIPYIHAKSITVDQKTVYLGSENFSLNSLLKARELGIIFEDAAIESRMHELYEKDWSKASTLPDTPPDHCSAMTPVVPFNPSVPNPVPAI